MPDRTMICPSCRSQPLQGQKFCRACGANLQVTTQPLEDSSRLPDSPDSAAIQLNNAHHRTNSYMLWGFVTLLIGAAIGVIGKKLLHQDIVTVVGVLISLLGMFLMVFPHLSPSRPRKRGLEARSQPAEATAPPLALEPGNIEYVPSITERTTNLLKIPAVTKPRREEDRTREA